jgi:type 1 glutamine amidotransferase
MRKSLLLGCTLLGAFSSCAGTPPPSEILIFTKTAGYRHGSIPTGIQCMQELAGDLKMTASATEDAADFTDENLKRFAAVVFLSTTQDVLDERAQGAFERYIQAGGGYMGVHAATDTEYDWAWYTGLAGAQFMSHPKVQQATVVRTDADFRATEFLPERWDRTDEWYNFQVISPDVTTVLVLDEASYEGGENGAFHPEAWYHEYDGGRAFYTGGGHTKQSFGEPLFRRHLKEGLAWAAGQ